MLIFDKNLSTGIFIRSFKTGYVIQEPSIRVCKLEFDIAEYNDTLFSTFTIEFPESLSSTILKRRAEYLAGRISAQTLLVIKRSHFVATEVLNGQKVGMVVSPTLTSAQYP